MSSATSVRTSPSTQLRHGTARRILSYVVFVLLLVMIGSFGVLYWGARSALPQLDGAISLAGISSKVRVIRGEHGVPTIEAVSLEDLFFAQGYVTAQDRLWQMDIMRRAAAGELSEVIGPDTIKIDREQRILGLRAAAEAALKNVSPRDRTFFEAYARGVNAFLESHRDRLSLEFRILKYQPRRWSVSDSLLVGARMVEDLNHSSNAPAMTQEKILAKLGPQLTSDLYVNSSWRDRPPTDMRRIEAAPGDKGKSGEDEDEEEVDPDGGASRLTEGPEPSFPLVKNGKTEPVRSPRLHANLTADTDLGPDFLDPNFTVSALIQRQEELFRPGSNNWVVSGQHTVSGKPLLSNDMHLDHQMPNLWYAAHLKTTTGDFDVAGVTLPGIPFVIVGHNQRIGWGFTNVGPTVEDDYIEEFNAQGQYKTPAGWIEPEHRSETIRVKGKDDVTLDVVTTRHGPIITELLPGETRKIALRWTLQDGMGLVFFDVNSAHNWAEFRKAFSNFGAPGQNVMYADVDGHIGYQATGRVPIRTQGDGRLPVNGSDDAHGWKGWIPFDEMPRIYDPPSGILATANGRIAPDGYKYSISTEWEAPWRTDRIYRVLESGKKFAPADMLALQTDVFSTYDRLCADKFVYAVDHAAHASDRAKRAVEILRDWDGRMSANSAAPTIETKARQELQRLLLEPKLGAAPSGRGEVNRGELSWKSYRWAMSSVWLENVLTREPVRWLPPGVADYENLLTTTIENVVKQDDGAAKSSSAAGSGAPSDLNQWAWGKYYQVKIDHPVLGQLPLIGRYTEPGIHPLSGSNLTVKAVGRNFGASERLTWNFANFDESTLNLVTGESGIFLSPYYMDQWPAWYGGSTFPFPFTVAATEQRRAHELTLQPR
jgi:penicillin G amidase